MRLECLLAHYVRQYEATRFKIGHVKNTTSLVFFTPLYILTTAFLPPSQHSGYTLEQAGD